MSAVNFSASGTRWRALPITRELLVTQQIPPLPGTGVLFTSADGEMRFLAMGGDEVPSADYLRGKPTSELGALVQLAKPLAR